MNYFYVVEGVIRNNIGDVLQGIVAKAFLPEKSIAVDREALLEMPNEDKSLLIANGWYMHTFDKFPPPKNINPIYISVHIANSQLLADPLVRKHFAEHAPIGCRDAKTLKLFLGWGIPAYYSSCLTITTQSRTPISKEGNGQYLLVDNVDHPVPNDIIDKVEKLFDKKLIRVSHDPPDTSGDFQSYVNRAELRMEELLKQYCEASLVITTKIHCALPCLGMGARVLFIHPNPRDPRLATVKEFLQVISYDDLLKMDKVVLPKVNVKKLQKRKALLTYIVKESIKAERNILQVSHTRRNQLLNMRTKLLSKLVASVLMF